MENKNENAIINILKVVFAYIIMLNHIYINYNNSSHIMTFIIMIALNFYFCTSGFFLFGKMINNPDWKKVFLKYFQEMVKNYLIWSLIMLVFKIPEAFDYIKDAKAFIVWILKYMRIVLFIGDYQLWYLLGLIQVLLIVFVAYRSKKFVGCIVTATVLVLFKYIFILGQTFNIGFIKDVYRIYYLVFGSMRNGLFFGFFPFVLGGVIYILNNKKMYSKYLFVGSTLLVCLVLCACLLFDNENMHMIVALLCGVFLLFTVNNLVIDIRTRILRKLSSWVFVSHMFFVLLSERIIMVNNYIIEMIVCFLMVTLCGLIKYDFELKGKKKYE